MRKRFFFLNSLLGGFWDWKLKLWLSCCWVFVSSHSKQCPFIGLWVKGQTAHLRCRACFLRPRWTLNDGLGPARVSDYPHFPEQSCLISYVKYFILYFERWKECTFSQLPFPDGELEHARTFFQRAAFLSQATEWSDVKHTPGVATGPAWTAKVSAAVRPRHAASELSFHVGYLEAICFRQTASWRNFLNSFITSTANFQHFHGAIVL